MKTYWRVEVYFHTLLTSALDGVMELSGQPHASAALFPGTASLYQLNSRLVGLQRRPGRGDEEKNSCPCRELNISHPARGLVTILTELHLHTKNCCIEIHFKLHLKYCNRHIGVETPVA